MKRLRYDITEGFEKGIIDAYENDNNTEIYKISLLKGRFRNAYDLTGKSVKMCLMNPKDKSGTIINIGIEDQVKGLIQLPIKSEITLKDGTYLCQFTITGANFKQTTKIFTINIKSNLFNDISGSIQNDERFPILEDALNRLDALETELEPMINTLEVKLPELQNALDDISGYLNFTNEIKKARRNYPDIDTRIMSDINGVNDNLEKFNYLPYEGENIQVKNSLNGYTRDLVIKGKTLHNLCSFKGRLNPTSQSKRLYMDSKNIDLIKPNTVYTYIFVVTKNTLVRPDSTNVFKCGDTDSRPNNRSIIRKQFVVQTGVIGEVVRYVFTTKTEIDKVDCPYVDRVEVFADNSEGEMEGYSMLLEGDYSNKEIPSQYFEGIKSAGELEENKISILSNNKNICNDKNFELGNYSSNGKPIGNTTGGTTYKRTKERIKIKPYTKYSISFKAEERKIGVFTYNNNDSFVRGIYDLSAESFTTYSHEKYLRFRIIDTATDIQMEEGNKTEYKPYKDDKKDILLPFTDGLKSLPNGVSDEISKRIIYKNVDVDILNGTEDWREYTKNDNTIIFYYRDDKFKNSPGPGNSISNLFKYDHSFDDIDHFHINQSNGLMVTISKNKLKTNDVNGFKEWLSRNNLKVYYKLKESAKYKIDIDLNLQSFKDITYITSENEIKPNISCNVLSNVPSVISELNEENSRLRQNESILKDGQLTLAKTLIGTLEAVILNLEDSEIIKENEQIIILQELILKLQNMR